MCLIRKARSQCVIWKYPARRVFALAVGKESIKQDRPSTSKLLRYSKPGSSSRCLSSSRNLDRFWTWSNHTASLLSYCPLDAHSLSIFSQYPKVQTQCRRIWEVMGRSTFLYRELNKYIIYTNFLWALWFWKTGKVNFLIYWDLTRFPDVQVKGQR